MGLQKVAFNFMVERGGKLAKSLLCSKPQKAVTNINGLKLTPKIETNSIKIERKLSDFAQENREYLEKELSRLFGTRKTLRNGVLVPTSKSDIQELIYQIKNAYDLTIITNLSNTYTLKEICDLMQLPQKSILQRAESYKIFAKKRGWKDLYQISAKELKEILLQYPNLNYKYFSSLFDMQVPIAGGEFRNLTLEEIKSILKSSKTQDKFMRVMCSDKSTKQAIKATEQKVPSSRTVPRFVYHMTNKDNYLKILEFGQLKTTSDEAFGKGIFMIDLENFFKHWKHDYSWGSESLQIQLIKQCKKGQDELVILKIPTSTLDYKKIVVRSQQRLFSHLTKEDEKELCEFVEKDLLHNKYKEEDIPNMLLRSINRYLDKLSRQDNHIYTGSPVCESKLFKQRKEAIEYIYSEPIKIDKVEKIGEVNVEKIKSTPEYDPMHPIRSIFGALLSGTPEAKGVKLIKE